jgi:uncharacterized membrane protein
MNELDELEQLVAEQEPEPAPNNAPLDRASFAYHAAVIFIDLITAYTVGVLTFWYYGIVWFLGNAVFFFLHHSNWERAENNADQNKNALIGMIVAVGSMFIIAATSGALLVAKVDNTWVKVGFEITAVTTFFFHAGMFAFYRFMDDDWKIRNQIANARAIANKKVKIARAAGLVIEANQKALDEKNKQVGKYGGGVVEAALAKVEKRDQKTKSTANAQTEQPTPANASNLQASYASSAKNFVEDLSVDQKNPTNGKE